MVYLLNQRVIMKEFHHLRRVLRVPVQPQGERLHTLQQQERVEGRDGGARIPQQDGAYVGHERGRSHRVIKRDAMIAGVRRGDVRILAARLPVKLSGFHDDAAQGRSVAAEELRRGMDHDVRAVLDGADPVGRAEGIVDHEGQAVPMGDFRDGVDVRNIAVGIAEGLQIDRPGVLPDGTLHLLKVMGVHKGGFHPVLGQGVLQQVEAAAVDCFLGHDMAAVGSQGLDRIRDRRGAGGHRQGRASALQGGHALLQHLLGGVRQPAVDIAGIREAEAVRRVLTVAENIGGGLIDRHGAGVRCRIGLFLAYVKLKGFEFILTHGFLSFIHC